MKVLLRTPLAEEGCRYRWLTINREYVVLGIECDSYRLLADTREPILFDGSCFQITDEREPEFWISDLGKEGERCADPRDWGVPGFFEAWHDGDSVIRELFAAQLAAWYPEVSPKG